MPMDGALVVALDGHGGTDAGGAGASSSLQSGGSGTSAGNGCDLSCCSSSRRRCRRGS